MPNLEDIPVAVAAPRALAAMRQSSCIHFCCTPVRRI